MENKPIVTLALVVIRADGSRDVRVVPPESIRVFTKEST